MTELLHKPFVSKLAKVRNVPARFPEELLEHEWREASALRNALEEYLQQLRAPATGREKVLSQIREGICSDFRFSRATFFRVLAPYKKCPRISTILRLRHTIRKSTKRLSKIDDQLIVKARKAYFSRNPEGSLLGLCIATEKLFKHRRAPSHSTICRRYHELSQRDKCKLRYGAKAAGQLFNVITHSTPEQRIPLHRIQIDHTLCDLACVDPFDRQASLRPWITIAMDECSRGVLAFLLSFEYPSSAHVARVLARAVAPKSDWLAGLGIEAEWPFFGKFNQIYVDNGMDLSSEAIRFGCQDWGIPEPEKRPPGRPHYGGQIERLIGTVMEETKLLDGKTAREMHRRSKSVFVPGREKATMTIDDYEAWLANFFVKYHNREHRSLGIPPIVKWDRAINGFGDEPGCGQREQVEDVDAFFNSFLEFDTRTLRTEGFVWDYIKYSDEALQTLLNSWKGEDFLVKRDPFDVSYIRYLHPEDGQYYFLPATTPGLEGVTKAVWQEAKRQVQVYDREHHDQVIAMAIESMAEIETNAAARTRAARRRSKEDSARKLAAEFGPKDGLSEPSEQIAPKPFVPLEFTVEMINEL